MQFFAQAFLFIRVLPQVDGITDGHDDVFREFADTLIALLEVPQPTARIRAVPGV